MTRTASANHCLRKDPSRPEILRPQLQIDKKREPCQQAFNENSALQRLTGLAERKSLKDRALDGRNTDVAVEPAYSQLAAKRFSYSNNSHRKTALQNLTRNAQLMNGYKERAHEKSTAQSNDSPGKQPVAQQRRQAYKDRTEGARNPRSALGSCSVSP